MSDETDLPQAVAYALALTAELDDATDALNKAIMAFEQLLDAVNPGVPAGVPLPQEDPGGISRRLAVHKLAVGPVQRHEKRWRLAIETRNKKEPLSVEILVNCSRRLRLQAVKAMPLLLDEINRTAAEELAKVREAAAEVEALAESMRRKS